MRSNFITSTISKSLLTAGVALICHHHVHAQQLLIGSGGKFESTAPYDDYVTLLKVNHGTQNAIVFDTVKTQSVQTMYLKGRHLYTGAQDSIMLHHADNQLRLASAAFNQPAVLLADEQHLYAGRASYGTGSQLKWLDATTLAEVASFDTITTGVSGLWASSDSLYVSYNIKSSIDLFPPWGVYGDSAGRMAVFSIADKSLIRIMDLGTNAAGIGKLHGTGLFNGPGSGNFIAYCKENKQLLMWNTATGNHSLHDFSIANALLAGGSMLPVCELKKQDGSKGIGRIDLNTMMPVDADTIEVPETVYKKNNKSIKGFAVASPGNYYLTTPDFANRDTLYYIENGSVASKTVVGISTEVLLYDAEFELTLAKAGQPSPHRWLAFPNPARNEARLNAVADEIKLYATTGIFVAQFANTDLIPTASLNTGMYLVHISKNGFTHQLILVKE